MTTSNESKLTPRELTYEEIQRVIRQGRAERNRAVGELFVGFFGLVKQQIKAIIEQRIRFGEWYDLHHPLHR